MDVRDKVIKLLRLARDRGEDSPEGETAAKIAADLMDEHDIEVDLDTEEHKQHIRNEWIVEADEPVPWMEMLLVSLCDLIYGGVVMPMVSPAGWRVYIVSEADEVEIDALAHHFAFLQKIIEPILEPLIAHGTEHEAKSFSLGMVYGITELFFFDMHDRPPDMSEMPFLAPALEAASEADQAAIVEDSLVRQHDSFAATMEDNMAVFAHAQPESPPPPPPPQEPTVNAIRPDWRLFEEGRRTAHSQIEDPYPPERQEARSG